MALGSCLRVRHQGHLWSGLLDPQTNTGSPRVLRAHSKEDKIAKWSLQGQICPNGGQRQLCTLPLPSLKPLKSLISCVNLGQKLTFLSFTGKMVIIIDLLPGIFERIV